MPVVSEAAVVECSALYRWTLHSELMIYLLQKEGEWKSGWKLHPHLTCPICEVRPGEPPLKRDVGRRPKEKNKWGVRRGSKLISFDTHSTAPHFPSGDKPTLENLHIPSLALAPLQSGRLHRQYTTQTAHNTTKEPTDM